MFHPKQARSSFSAKDLSAIKQFYNKVLELKVEDAHMGIEVTLPGDVKVAVYQSDKSKPATFTLINFIVDNIDEAVDTLADRGVVFERYDAFPQDEKSIARGLASHRGPDAAWFKDPEGNILEVLQVA